MFQVVFHHPEIPGNTGNAVRMVAGSGCALHLVRPLGFSVADAKLRRAGLDYRDRAALHVHDDWEALLRDLAPKRIVAFTSSAETSFEQVSYFPGDVLLFGRESTGLPPEVLDSERITARVRIPMLPGIRSMNLANSAAVAVYEAWRQQNFAMP
ncbi:MULTISPECIES: tRNA (cytidine(34)-2'-O)-methyltransferase [unclassified Saccharopolyspora]|uniref:tRNA (cytidine(34)-2'-O)-methyltransferase n=1 Tax=Saccharopolyspora TaxID=1835 RepID=UPI001909C134|nr:tRNA (cytidine(34)-2'-O)-methyltransferase [Saccharopolyspora sp. HNM0986]MBK0867109.1 tRNA (cytidine(34)-2'-O)-methyltransferase [Saccharopolyspora sp. HNM0986]